MKVLPAPSSATAQVTFFSFMIFPFVMFKNGNLTKKAFIFYQVTLVLARRSL